MKYFAYGSNMNSNRLRERIPSAEALFTGSLKKFALRFHKRSMDGSSKCDAFYTNNNLDEVQGVIYEIDDFEKINLDEVEGKGKGYNQITIRVLAENKTIETFTYVADPNSIDETIKPYTWYKDLVISGASEHNLPEAYILEIEKVDAKLDLNKEREELHLKLIQR